MRSSVQRWVLLAIALVFLAIYWPCLNIVPAGDDWQLLTPVRSLIREYGWLGALGRVFTTTVGDFYRPVAWIPLFAVTNSLVGVQALKLAAMLGFLWLIVRTARALKLSEMAGLLIGAATILHQVFASVTTECDLWGDFFSAVAFVALLLLALKYSAGTLRPIWYAIWSILVSVACVLSKEAGVACFLTPLFFAALNPLQDSASKRRVHVSVAGALLLVAIGYLVIRVLLGARFSASSGYYEILLGTNVAKNIVLALLALFSPVSTVKVAVDGSLWRALAAAWTCLCLGLAAWGLVRSKRSGAWRMGAVLAVLFFAAQGPVFFMPHLTEANFTRSLALGWFAFAFVVEPAARDAWAHARWRVVIVGVLCLWLVFDLPAAYSKCRDIVRGQTRAERFRRELVTLYPSPPADGFLLAVRDPGYRGYSVYRQPLLDDFQTGEMFAVRDLYRSSKLRADWRLVKDADEATAIGALALVEDDGSVRPLPTGNASPK